MGCQDGRRPRYDRSFHDRTYAKHGTKASDTLGAEGNPADDLHSVCQTPCCTQYWAIGPIGLLGHDAADQDGGRRVQEGPAVLHGGEGRQESHAAAARPAAEEEKGNDREVR
jgi:hypothetical protein